VSALRAVYELIVTLYRERLFINLISDMFFRFEDKLQTTHLPEMVFGESSVSLEHAQTGVRLHFNALDALRQWKQEALPPVQVPAAAKWKFRRFFYIPTLLLNCARKCF
jgi:hypothetical protein